MREYQEKYIENLLQVMALSDFSSGIPEDIPQFIEERRQNNIRIRGIIRENTELLRTNLMPVLDDIASASDEEIAELEDFASHLLRGARQLDLVLNYTVRNALVAFARRHGRRDMLIRQLYHTGMALFYMQQIIRLADKNDYNWKMSLMFGEAASYIRQYDEIEDAETRGYIHRAMANLALAYRWDTPEEAERKSKAIRRSFHVLTDPEYHRKTPSLPWDTFLYKSHQERTTAMQMLRMGTADARIVREVMESAEYVYKKQMEDVEKKGRKPSARWVLEYDIALYHCGVLTLSQLLTSMEKVFMDQDAHDFSMDGLWGNAMLPAYYAEYLRSDESLIGRKKEVLLYMYGRMIRYVHGVPNGTLNSRLISHLLDGLTTFIEYPDGIQARDFLINLVISRDPDIYVFLQLTADITRMITQAALETVPEQLVGVLSCEDVSEVRRRGPEIAQFAYECGMLHDIGIFLFDSLVTTAARSQLEEEKRMYGYHTDAGRRILSRCESTQKYVPAALGHHRFYDGSGGYPEEYRREEDPNRQITDIVGIASYLVGLTDVKFGGGSVGLTPEEALAQVRREAGTRLSPVFVQLLPQIEGELTAYLREGVVRAYEQAFDRIRGEDAEKIQ